MSTALGMPAIQVLGQTGMYACRTSDEGERLCFGNTSEQKGIFAALQRAVNDALPGTDLSDIDMLEIDGVIGPKTTEATAAVLRSLGAGQGETTADATALNAALFLTKIAGETGISPDFTPPMEKPKSVSDVEALPPGIVDEGKKNKWRLLWWGLGLSALFGTGYVGYRLLTEDTDGEGSFAGFLDLFGKQNPEFDYGEAVEDFIDV